MDAFVKFLDMGGYAAWVWPAYGLAVVGFVGMLVWSMRTLKARERDFDALKNSRDGQRR